MTTGTTVAFLSQSCSTSIFRSWYLVIFSTSFCWILLSPGIATSTNHTCFFSTTVMSGMLYARCLSVWILKSQRILASLFCSTFSILWLRRCCRTTAFNYYYYYYYYYFHIIIIIISVIIFILLGHYYYYHFYYYYHYYYYYYYHYEWFKVQF